MNVELTSLMFQSINQSINQSIGVYAQRAKVDQAPRAYNNFTLYSLPPPPVPQPSDDNDLSGSLGKCV